MGGLTRSNHSSTICVLQRSKAQEKGRALTLPGIKGGSSMKLRLAHENKAADLVLMSGETIGSVRGQCHSIFKIAMDRLQLWHNERLITEPGTTTLIKCGIPDGAVITVTVSAPVIKKKEVPATPLEA